jgi:hypothetical protein
MLGEVWYAEAETPLGPWAYARKIVTHHKQSFYNPRHHPFFDQQAGRVVYFEGTYTHTFSGNDERTPRYDYNQIMYRLDLGDERLTLPAAVYGRATAEGERFSFGQGKVADPTFRDVAFFACDRPFPNSTIVSRHVTDQGLALITSDSAPDTRTTATSFFAVPATTASPPKACVPLYEFTSSEGRRKYSVDKTELPGFQRAERPLCYVWPVPAD